MRVARPLIQPILLLAVAGHPAGSTEHLLWVSEVKSDLLAARRQVAGLIVQLLCSYQSECSGAGDGSGGRGGPEAGAAGRELSVAEAGALHALLCLAAWARMNLLHSDLGREEERQLVQAALGALQSPSEQVRTAGGGSQKVAGGGPEPRCFRSLPHCRRAAAGRDTADPNAALPLMPATPPTPRLWMRLLRPLRRFLNTARTTYWKSSSPP
jgi:hypothetical protein